jgi:hypothetical protein
MPLPRTRMNTGSVLRVATVGNYRPRTIAHAGKEILASWRRRISLRRMLGSPITRGQRRMERSP